MFSEWANLFLPNLVDLSFHRRLPLDDMVYGDAQDWI